MMQIVNNIMLDMATFDALHKKKKKNTNKKAWNLLYDTSMPIVGSLTATLHHG